jgi:enoyl-CoA hydratase/carnithine racemase
VPYSRGLGDGTLARTPMTDPSDNTENILVDFDAGVFTITFNRPTKKNAFSVAMYESMTHAFASARERADVRVIVLRGSEGMFTAGNDLMDFMRRPPTGPESPVAQFLNHLVACEKPIVAAVQGPAIGIGVTMLLHCDLVYAADNTRFRMPFVNLGLCPELGSSFLLPRIMGYQRAAELVLLGEEFSAEVAHAYGLVNQVLAADAVLAHAHAMAQRLASKPPAALRASKQLMRQPYRAQVEQALVVEYEAFTRGLASPEAAEALAAFFAKRPPDFSKFQ